MYVGWARWGLAMTLILPAGEAFAAAEEGTTTPKASGSLDEPRRFESVDELAEFCSALQLPLTNAEEEIELTDAYRKATEGVYQARVGPRGFALAPYKEPSLSLRLDRGLAALDGGLSLAVLDRNGGKFKLDASQATAIVAAAEEKKVALDVVFTVDHEAGDLTPCFSIPHSESFSLRVRPVSYELVDMEKGTVMARTQTSEHARLRALQSSGPPKVNVVVSHATGGRKAEEVEKVLQEKKDALAACMVKDRPDARPTDIVGLSAAVSPGGGMSSVHAEIASMEDAKVARCLEDALKKIVLPRSSTQSRIGVVVEVVSAQS